MVLLWQQIGRVCGAKDFLLHDLPRTYGRTEYLLDKVRTDRSRSTLTRCKDLTMRV